MTPMICTCGHSTLGHVGGGPCMDMECNCVLFEQTDPDTDGRNAHLLAMRDFQHDQVLWTTARLQADAEARTAQAQLWRLAWWLAAGSVPPLVSAICRRWSR